MTARCCALYFVIAELIILALGLIYRLVRGSGGGSAAVSVIVYTFFVGPDILILVGILKDSLDSLKWGVYLKTGFDSLVGILAFFAIAGCFIFAGNAAELAKDPEVAKDPDFERATKMGSAACIILAVLCALLAVPIIWGLWAFNAYYEEIAGIKLLPCCCCGTSTGRMVPVMMGPAGNVVMYTPSGHPIYGPPGAAVMMQPSQGQLSQQQQMMMMQQQQMMMQQQQQQQQQEEQ